MNKNLKNKYFFRIMWVIEIKNLMSFKIKFYKLIYLK